MIRAWGLERAKAVEAEGIAARADLARFIEDERIDCDWKLTGRFTGAMRPKHYESMAAECELLNRHWTTAARMVPKAEQRAEVGSDLYHGGMVREDIGGLHPGKLHQGMLDGRWRRASPSMRARRSRRSRTTAA